MVNAYEYAQQIKRAEDDGSQFASAEHGNDLGGAK